MHTSSMMTCQFDAIECNICLLSTKVSLVLTTLAVLLVAPPGEYVRDSDKDSNTRSVNVYGSRSS